MKSNKTLRTILIILVIVLAILVSFVGVYKQQKNSVNNILKEYQLGMDLSGSRQIEFEVDTSTETINYDSEGNEIDSSDTETEVANTEEKSVNDESILTEENFVIARNVMEKRMKSLGLENYQIRQNTETGEITINIPEDDNTDNIVAQLQYQGKFEITDNDTDEVLLSNDDVKNAKVGYGTTSSGYTAIYISIQFNKEGTEKYRNVTNTYVETTTTDEETGEETTETKKIAIKIDDSTLLTTYFDEEITNGVLQLTVGSSSSSTTTEDLQEYLVSANYLASLINAGKSPIIYEISQNRYIASEITNSNITVFVSLVIIVTAISMIYLIIKYKGKGVLSSISLVGYVAILLLVIRYANVVITLEGIIAILLSIVLFYIALIRVLKNKDGKVDFNGAIKKYILTLIPVYLISIVFTFNSWQPIFSFGMILFWGITINIIYNFIITKTLLVNEKD
jgi:preprotein translocase subunit SecD